MASTLDNLNRQRQQLREESKRLTRLLKQSRQQLAVETRREELAKDRRRRVGLCILAIASDALTFLKSYLKSELSTVSELVADSEYEEISKEFLALSPGAVNALTDDMDDTRCADLQQAIDWTIKSELHAWTSFQNLAKGIAPTAGMMIRQKQELQSRVMQPLEMTNKRSTQRSATYKWLSSWRRKWAMPSGRFGHRDTPSVEVMRAKVSIGLGLDFEKEIIPSRCRFFTTRSGPRSQTRVRPWRENEVQKPALFLGSPILILQKGWASFRPFFDRVFFFQKS